MIHQIIEMLKSRPYSFSELFETLQLKERRNLIKYLRKIEKICKEKGWKFIIYPAQCKKCGYVFKEEIKNPSKCPKCKSEWLEEPKFYIKD